MNNLSLAGLGFGLRIVEVREGYWRKRTWKERLFTRPWKPFVKEEWVRTMDDDIVYQVGDILYCTRKIAAQIREMTKQSGGIG